MTLQFLPAATCFDDMTLKVRPDLRTDGANLPAPTPPDEYTLCPVCKGYGGWVLQANVSAPYDTTQPPPSGWTWNDYIAFYGPRQHFRCHCSQCNGWGWVLSRDANCIHAFQELSQAQCREKQIAHFGRCYHVYECQLCGRIKHEDSSD